MKKTLLVLLIGSAVAAALLVSAAAALSPGRYAVTFKCGTGLSSAKVTKLQYTNNDVVVRTVSPLNIRCTPGKDGIYIDTPDVTFNDLIITYVCPADSLIEGVLDVAAGQLQLDKSYPLSCPSVAATPTAGPFPTPGTGDATIMLSGAVGGIAEAPDASALAATSSGRSSGGTYAVIAGIAAAIAVGGGGWYARRRWSK